MKAGTITVRARAKAQGREPISSLRLMVNGVEAPQYAKAIERVRLVSTSQGWVEREWTVPLVSGRLTLGQWQQIVLLDCDTRSRKREVVIQVLGA